MAWKKKALAALLAGVSVFGGACSSDDSGDSGAGSGSGSGSGAESKPTTKASQGTQGATKEQQEQIDQINGGVDPNPTSTP